MPQICIDFDGTIVEEHCYPNKPPLKPGVIETLTELKKMGFWISIYSCRNNPEITFQENRLREMIEVLNENNVPYDDIVMDPKPLAAYFVDDKAIHFTSWKDVLKQIEERENDNNQEP